jgi:hypothetical protein
MPWMHQLQEHTNAMHLDLNAEGELSRRPTEEDHRLQIQQMPEQFRPKFEHNAKLRLSREVDANGLC